MTREDAIFFLNELRSANNCDETIDMAIAALSEPVLDENGLARCGCGNPAKYEEEYGYYSVRCTGCDMVGGFHFENKAGAAGEWNTAMGWRADE